MPKQSDSLADIEVREQQTGLNKLGLLSVQTSILESQIEDWKNLRDILKVLQLKAHNSKNDFNNYLNVLNAKTKLGEKTDKLIQGMLKTDYAAKKDVQNEETDSLVEGLESLGA